MEEKMSAKDGIKLKKNMLKSTMLQSTYEGDRQDRFSVHNLSHIHQIAKMDTSHAYVIDTWIEYKKKASQLDVKNKILDLFYFRTSVAKVLTKIDKSAIRKRK